uniref:Uncharacterized protein n=1 Tax=viral metagenome TaxID=1070528 RepID=A0A6C0M2M4_9ZZZZ
MEPRPTIKIQPFNREASKQTVSYPSTPAWQLPWLIFKPQAHAIAPFPTNEPARTKSKS